MKKYILNSGTGTLHIAEFAGKNCLGKILKEHMVEFDTYEEAMKNSDRKLKKCKFCFHKKSIKYEE